MGGRTDGLVSLLPVRWEGYMTLAFLLLPNWLLSPGVYGQSVTKALTGGHAFLSSPNLTEKYQELTWFFSATSKILIWDPKGTTYFKTRMEHRVCLHGSTLHIWDLQKGDSSTYILQVLKLDGIQEERHVRLQVLDPVPTPTITIWETQPKASGCFLNLSCHLATTPEDPVTFAWHGPSGIQSGSELRTITKKMPVTYTCQASNSLSSRNSSVAFTHCPGQLGVEATKERTAPSSGKLNTATWLLVLVPRVLQALLP